MAMIKRFFCRAARASWEALAHLAQASRAALLVFFDRFCTTVAFHSTVAGEHPMSCFSGYLGLCWESFLEWTGSYWI